MKFISTTELRTKASQMVEQLKSGKGLKLIHRSEVVAKIEPYSEEKKRVLFSKEAFLQLMKDKPVRKMSYEDREKKYHQHMVEKWLKST